MYDSVPQTATLAETRIAVARMPPSATFRCAFARRLVRQKWAAATISQPARNPPGNARSSVLQAIAAPDSVHFRFFARHAERTRKNSQSCRRNAPPVQKYSAGSCVPQKIIATAMTRPPNAQAMAANIPANSSGSIAASSLKNPSLAGCSEASRWPSSVQTGGGLYPWSFCKSFQ